MANDDAAVIPSYHGPDTILAHPDFSAARLVFVRGMLALYEHDPFLNRLLNETGRALVSFNILSLHAAFDEGERATWPTMRLLRQTVQIYGGISSARRIDDIVARFVETGYVESRVAPSDRRARLLSPTRKLIEHDLDWLLAYYRPLDMLFPAPGYAAPLRRDSDYQKAHRVVGSRLMPFAAKLMNENSAVMLFMGRDAGMMILLKLIELTDAEKGAPLKRVSFTDIGERFGVSRTHVRKTLQDAQQAGLLEMSGRAVTLAPLLIAGFDRFLADTMAGHDLMYRMVEQQAGR